MRYPLSSVCIITDGGLNEVLSDVTPPELYLIVHGQAPSDPEGNLSAASVINVNKTAGLTGKYREMTQSEMLREMRRMSPKLAEELYRSEKDLPSKFSDYECPACVTKTAVPEKSESAKK